jgi:hypothetical protein
MAGMAVASGFGLAFTTDDLDSMPEDGNRYELVDGWSLAFPIRIARAELVRGLFP